MSGAGDLAELLALGISHKTAPVAVRERLSLPTTRAEAVLRELVATEAIHEAVVISTCNRTEVYLVGDDAVEAETTALGMLARLGGIRPTELSGSIYSLRNCDAARHLYRVTSGLESMVIGEHEVQGQVKRAYEQALASGVSGPLTNRIFRAALATGKRVRSETAISSGRVSISAAAVDLARDTVGDLNGRTVLLLGTGETTELTAAALARQGVETVFVANRRHERALELARRFDGRTVGFDDLPRELAAADIVVAATSSPHPLITQEDLELVMHERSHRPLLLIDLAVPRDIDSLCAELPAVTLFDLDDLQELLARSHAVRGQEAQAAEAIIEEEIQSFARWLGSLEVLPTLGALRRYGDAVVEGVLSENATRWEQASRKDLQRVEAIARAVMNRLLHEPTSRLKRHSEDGAHGRLQVVRELFGLEDDAVVPTDRPADSDAAQPAPVRELPARAARRPRR